MKHTFKTMVSFMALTQIEIAVGHSDIWDVEEGAPASPSSELDMYTTASDFRQTRMMRFNYKELSQRVNHRRIISHYTECIFRR